MEIERRLLIRWIAAGGFAVGLILVIRLLVLSVPAATPTLPPTSVAVIEVTQTPRPPLLEPSPTVALPSLPVLPSETALSALVPIEEPTETAPNQPTPTPTAFSEPANPSPAPPNPLPSAGSPTSEPAIVPSETSVAITPSPAPPTATATPAPPTITPTPSFRPRIVNNEIDPPWWPCQPAEVKGIAKLRLYYAPSHPRYAGTFVNVECFFDVSAATAAGYSPAP